MEIRRFLKSKSNGAIQFKQTEFKREFTNLYSETPLNLTPLGTDKMPRLEGFLV